MLPVLFKVGPLTLHTYGLLAAVGLFTGVFLAARRAGHEGVDKDIVADLGFYLVLAAIIGSRLLYVVVEYKTYLAEPLRIFKIWEGGLVFFGGVMAAVPTGWWFVRKHNLDFWKMADIFAPYLALAHAIGRLGCLAAGCCYGRPTDAWFGVVFTNPDSLAPLGVPLIPTQVFDSLNEFSIFLILIAVRPYKKFQGQLLVMWLMLYSVGRFFIEIYRGDPRGWLIEGALSTSQFIAILTFIAAGVYFLKSWRKAK
ncbi:MAG: prolipoprotein diacylglyceryl transferase [Nitrospinae bacterium]|nr:prolipoprotein diacylglyceryl transferase [Nitrospinota bacterium]